MFEQRKSNVDILFKKSLRSGNKSAKLTKKNSQFHDSDTIQRQLSQIVFEMQNKNNSFELAIQLLTEESSVLRQHLSFQVFIPEIRTQFGEKLLKDKNLWIIILVVFHSLCKEKSKYSDFLQKNILNSMQKNYQDENIMKSIQKQANQIISTSEVGEQQLQNQSASKCSKKQLRVQFQENKENQQSASNHKQYQVSNQIEYSKEQENTLSNEQLKKKIDDLTQSCLKMNKESLENQEIVVPQVEEIINEQVKELEEELKNKHDQSNKTQRQSITEKLFSQLGFKAWRSEQKQIIPNPIQTKMRGIRLLDGLDSRELQTSYVARVEKILVPNLNDNGLHSIVQVRFLFIKLSAKNSQELLEWGFYAIIQLSNQDCASKQYFEDMQYYKQLVGFKFRQEKQIYIPFGKYELII
ncbi:unnamed protein product (macronuclear) [Paramecium tetraurelia]|uniref:Uncharacterized protein n=1 Tax=Paramecium tetraurelia TaxID=5888 RepID=A0DL16_PARTE|nr:uncharacterized protein GSPATT00018050001 [Paramecium tetraurelia]CAK83733.1 unnamed protein product [Paramecium tetraurelia]|eukprot:XP_001451130.1 hypothetical protein (macronuclear) [Paramecium tetraurelia strain d4-2]